MQRFCEILQAVCDYVCEFTVRITRKMYHSSAVFIAAFTMVSVLSVSVNSYGSAARTTVRSHQVEAGEETAGIPPDEETSASEDGAGEQVLLAAKEVGAAMSAEAVMAAESRAAVLEEVQPKVSAQKEQAAIEAEKQAKKDAAVIPYDDYDLECLQRIVQAEAGGEDAEGKLLVADVIVNRVKSSEFPNNLYDVIYQHGQFQPVSSGVIDQVAPTEETIEMVDRALAGEDHSQGALYFMNREEATRMNAKWFDHKLTYVMSHGGHEFYR